MDWFGYVLGLGLLAVLALGWWLLAPGPRRRRACRRAQRLLRAGNWQEALQLMRRVSRDGLSRGWKGRLAHLEAECERAATTTALAERDFESALQHSLNAAALRGRPEQQARGEIVEAMLDEARRQFAASRETAPLHRLIDRIQRVQTPCPEASFWQGLCHIRDDNIDKAMALLHAAREQGAGVRDQGAGGRSQGSGGRGQESGGGRESDDSPLATHHSPITAIDPPLYLGSLLLRQGQAREALRYLTEANRIDGQCPFVGCQLGQAMLAAGSDPGLAVRALQRALGPRGLGQWQDRPARAWLEGMPEGRSYIRRLAEKHIYSCPLWGADLRLLERQAAIALGDGLYRLGQYQESRDIFGKLIQESAPTLPVLRGYGLALARLGEYDEAFKHLRAALELEEQQDPPGLTRRLVAGYLALCGARGTPARPEDKPRNVLWAIRLVQPFTAPGDVEWANLIGAIFAEARALQLPIDRDDQLYLCEHLCSVSSADPQAAEGYHHLQATHPRVMTSEYAWLFCRASQQHGITGPHAAELFARTFAESDLARVFFQQRGWNFDDLEVTYLERAAALEPGAFPTVLGAEYAPRGEALLLQRSRQQEQTGQMDAARATAETWLRLSPHSPRAHDRLAYLLHRQGNPEQALTVLDAWCSLHPHDATPLLRRAALHQQMGRPTHCLADIRQAMQKVSGPRRADIAVLGTRWMLRSLGLSNTGAGQDGVEPLRDVAQLLEEGLAADPRHASALWLLAALRSLLGDQEGLARQAQVMDRPEIDDPRFHYAAAVCHLAARNPTAVLQCSLRVQGERLADRMAGDPAADSDVEALAVESAYLAGLAYAMQDDASSAMEVLRKPAQSADSPSASHAQALLGQLAFATGSYDQAIAWWQKLDPKKRLAWRLNESLAGAIFLTALALLHDGRYEEAADRIRQAGRAGFRDPRLGPLLTLALFKAGQRWLYNPVG